MAIELTACELDDAHDTRHDRASDPWVRTCRRHATFERRVPGGHAALVPRSERADPSTAT
jgi:hypothetical protein